MIKRTVDTLYTYRFIRTLVRKWEDTEAYKLGIIDAEGTKLRSPKTNEEKNAYTFFHRVVFNIKRLIQKAPMGRRLISFAVALKLLKEETGINEEELVQLIEEATGFHFTEKLNEETTNLLDPGIYSLTTEFPTRYKDLPEGSLIKVTSNIEECFGKTLYEAKHVLTEETIYITENEVANTAATVTTSDVVNIPKPIKMPNGDKYQEFTVPPTIFNRINNGRKRYQRWNKYLDLNDSKQNTISQFAKKYRNATVIIKDEATGATRALKPSSLSDYQT